MFKSVNIWPQCYENKRSENQIKMRAKSLLTLQHILFIFVAIKTALYLKVDNIFGLGLINRSFYYQRLRRIEHYTGPPISVEPGLGPVKNPDNTYNILNQVYFKVTILHLVLSVDYAEKCQLPPISRSL